MTTFAASQDSGEPGGIAGDAVIRRLGRRDKIEALGMLLGKLGILLGLALTVGTTFPFGS